MNPPGKVKRLENYLTFFFESFQLFKEEKLMNILFSELNLIEFEN